MQLEYELIYSDRKTVNISVERDRSIVVRAPHNTPREKIDAILEKKKLWLFEKTHHIQKYPLTKDRKEFVTGETLMYLGRNYKLHVVSEKIKGVDFQQKFIISKENQPKAYSLFKAWYVNKAKEKIEKIATEYAQSLGVEFNSLRVSELKYTWGSCSPNNNLNFNWRLIKAPLFVIKYIVVHELTHIIELNHTPHFWNILSIQIPNFEKAKKWLKQNGELLETDF